MNIATDLASYPAAELNSRRRKTLALESLNPAKSITDLANDNQVSRKFIHQQKNKLMTAINGAFEEAAPDEILFHLPVTQPWLEQFIISLHFHGKSGYRGIQNILKDVFDHDISIGNISNIIDKQKSLSKQLNDLEELDNVRLSSLDEMYHQNKPILTGIDIDSLYCFLMSQEDDRDGDTWSIHLWDCQAQGLSPERTIADDADPIALAHKRVFGKTPFDLDHFHILNDIYDVRRYYRNRLKSIITEVKMLQEKVDKRLFKKNMETYEAPLALAIENKKLISTVSKTFDILAQWLRHDVFYMPGSPPREREVLFDFILKELKALAKISPHRIKEICVTLKNQKEQLLAFVDVLDKKFDSIADEFNFPIEWIWDMCILLRCDIGSDNYAIRSLELQVLFGKDFDVIEDAVLVALETTQRTSSMIENLHSRIKPHLVARQNIDAGYLDLLRFFINHKPFDNRAKPSRAGKTPTEILLGKSHPHWLEMLGYTRFKKAA